MGFYALTSLAIFSANQGICFDYSLLRRRGLSAKEVLHHRVLRIANLVARCRPRLRQSSLSLLFLFCLILMWPILLLYRDLRFRIRRLELTAQAYEAATYEGLASP